MKNKLINLLIGFIILVAVYIALYPTISNYYWQSKQTATIESYNDAIKHTTQEEIETIRNNAIKYNEELYKRFKTSVFTYQGSNKTDEDYESQLNLSKTMAYIEIPKINLYLPIVHGTKASDLDSMVGHLYLTSLPVGGENTHSIISAHTGLAQSKLFTDIDKLKVGDKFYIYVLDKKLCYQVVETNVCMPAEDFHYMQIEDGKDLISLYTCTPYGINDHRLIVKGEHLSSEDITLEIPKDNMEVENQNKTAITLFYVLLLSPFVCYIIYTVIIMKGKKKPKKEVTDETT